MPNVADIGKEILTLEIEGSSPVTFQYIPASISISHTSMSSSSPGMHYTITYLANKDTFNSELNISVYFTVLEPFNGGDISRKGIIIAGSAATTALALSLGGGKALDVINAATSNLNLVSGSIDLATGIIKGNSTTVSPVSFSQTAFNRIKLLHDALDRSLPVKINWDLERNTANQKYIITSLVLTAERMQSGTTNSLEVKCDLKLQKYGVGVRST